MLYNPIQRLRRRFVQESIHTYPMTAIIADLDNASSRDQFLLTVALIIPAQADAAFREEVKEEALATWFWWKLS